LGKISARVYKDAFESAVVITGTVEQKQTSLRGDADTNFIVDHETLATLKPLFANEDQNVRFQFFLVGRA